MIDLLKLYDILKPPEEPERYTTYPLILGGSDTLISLEAGAWVLNLLNSKVETKPDRFMVQQGDLLFEVQTRIITTLYQLDFWRAFNNACDGEFIVQKEATQMQGWLNSPFVAEDLLKIDGEIIPAQSAINYTSELGANKVVLNRATFDFAIISYEKIGWNAEKLETIELKGGHLNAKISRN